MNSISQLFYGLGVFFFLFQIIELLSLKKTSFHAVYTSGLSCLLTILSLWVSNKNFTKFFLFNFLWLI